ncbi:MAG: hypothetical protein N2442_14675 [Spirochaetes bacterium]|nr:hypothetical protein [Spirochaetota bacterium]
MGLLFTFVFAQNVLLYYFFGIDSVEDMKDDRSRFLIQEGLVLIGVCSCSGIMIRSIHQFILLPLGLTYLKTVTAVLLILVVGKITDSILKRFKVSLNVWRLMVNSLVVGISLLAVHGKYSLGESFMAGLSAGLGYLFAVYLLGVLQEQFKREWIPRSLQGVPILAISAGLMAMAFLAIDAALLKRIFG